MVNLFEKLKTFYSLHFALQIVLYWCRNPQCRFTISNNPDKFFTPNRATTQNSAIQNKVGFNFGLPTPNSSILVNF